MASYPDNTCPINFSCLTFDYKDCNMNYISSGNITRSSKEIENDPINRSICNITNSAYSDYSICDIYDDDTIIGKTIKSNCKNKYNNYKFNKYSSNKWSNVTGYGNITINSYDNGSNIYTDIHPYNRINKLDKPYNIKTVNEKAWNLNKIKKIY